MGSRNAYYTPAKGVEASTHGSQWMSEGADVARMSATVEEKVERVQQFLLALRVHRIFTTRGCNAGSSRWRGICSSAYWPTTLCIPCACNSRLKASTMHGTGYGARLPLSSASPPRCSAAMVAACMSGRPPGPSRISRASPGFLASRPTPVGPSAPSSEPQQTSCLPGVIGLFVVPCDSNGLELHAHSIKCPFP